MMTDPLGDMLTRIRNGQMAKKAVVTAPASRLRANVLEVLKREGYIRGYSEAEARAGVSELTIELKYHEGTPVIREISRVSKPGRRVYSAIKDLNTVLNFRSPRDMWRFRLSGNFVDPNVTNTGRVDTGLTPTFEVAGEVDFAFFTSGKLT